MIKLKIDTYNSGNYEVEVETYNASEINQQLNDRDINTVLVGDLIFSRIEVKLITPITEALKPEIPVEENNEGENEKINESTESF
ncbi:hypothetical protein [Cytobacillus purgationiresistens]|uniref:Nicotinamide N-methyase n=1 Tax=Cytobacillus purgationiresistens TaxID=863449 RepID=A0ABU0AHH5_9BACI|nr:hypothetical protein [Cytobacillus purgationiresistens]MDQ0270715.1 putative nicotinamide N-methyase [Cytobacillus purgationiresistens]